MITTPKAASSSIGNMNDSTDITIKNNNKYCSVYSVYIKVNHRKDDRDLGFKSDHKRDSSSYHYCINSCFTRVYNN